MRVKLVYDFTIEDRQAIADYYGDGKPASHADVQRWMELTILGTLETLHSDMAMREQYERERAEEAK